jgi:hypothetical protein
MSNFITSAEGATEDDGLDVLGLSLFDLIDGGIDEALAREYLGITPFQGNLGRDAQIRKFQKAPLNYHLLRNSTGHIDAMLKTGTFSRADEDGYGVTPIDRLLKRVEIKTIGNKHAKERIGIVALSASPNINQDEASDQLISHFIEGMSEEDRTKDIVIPLHTYDPAMNAVIRHGFKRSLLTSTTVNLPVEDRVIRAKMNQRLFIRRAS